MLKKFLSIIGILVLFASFANCSKGGGSSSDSGGIKLKATFSQADYTTAHNFHLLDTLWANLVQGLAYASGTHVTQLWMIPLQSGEFSAQAFSYVQKADVVDNAVSIDVSQSTWAAMLIDDTQLSKKDQVVGFLAMSSADAALTAIPLDKASGDIDYGEVGKGEGGDTKSSRDTADNAEKLAYDASVLLEIAKADDGIKSVKNAYRNYNDGTYFSVKPFHVWRRSSAYSAINNTFSSAQELVDSHYHGYLFYMNSNNSAIQYSGICDQTVALTMTPPAAVSSYGASSPDFGPSAPFDSSSGSHSSSGNSCGAGGLYLRDDSATYGSYQMNFSANGGEYLTPPIPSGDWTVRVGSTVIGEFEGDVGSIFQDDDTTKPIVFIPSVKVNNTGGNVTSVEVKWYHLNSGTGLLEEATDATLLSRMQSVAIGLTNYSSSPRQEERSGELTPTTGYSFTPSDTFTFAPGNNLSVDVGYTMDNIAIHVEHRL